MRVLAPWKILRLRLASGLRQSEIFERFGLSPTVQSRMENGHVQDIKPCTLSKVIQAYKCKADDIYVNQYRPPSKFEENTIRHYMDLVKDIVCGSDTELEDFYFEIKLKDKTKLEVVYSSTGDIRVRR